MMKSGWKNYSSPILVAFVAIVGLSGWGWESKQLQRVASNDSEVIHPIQRNIEALMRFSLLIFANVEK